MGVMRRVEHGIERTFEGLFGRGRKAHVQPPELAVKLVKEMEASRRASVSHTYVANLYTVYVCPEDRNELRPMEDHLRDELAAHLEEHARGAGYAVVGPVQVHLETDPDLRLGRFGIQTEMSEATAAPLTLRSPASGEPGWQPMPLAQAAVPETGAAVVALPPSGVPAGEDGGIAMASAAASAVATGARGAAGNLLAGPVPSDTQSIPAQVARELDLARQVVVLRQGGRRREFHKTRIVLGRSRECDFPLDDANVSRRHAVIYWETGTAFVKDLDSTNGTLLNGRPVTSAQLADADVLTLGGTPVAVELR